MISFKHYDEQDNLVTDNFVYNSLGNPTTYRDKSVTWQYGKYLTQLGNTTFAYDGLGRRISKGNISFTYDNENNLIKQSNGLEFIYDDKGVVGVKYNGAQYFYRKDAQGNIIAILDSSGKVVVEYKYDAWGNHRVFGLNKVDYVEVLQDIYDEEATGFDVEYLKYKQLGESNPFRYRGYYYDIETSLYYLQTRYYDPEVGRFISQDSIEYADPETINGLNLYAYCGNNPVMNVDPTGKSFLLFLVAALVGFAVSFASSAISQAVFNGGQVNWGIAAIDGLFGAISGALWMVPGLGPVATGFINAGLTAINGIITTGIESNWQFTWEDGISIGASAILSGIFSGVTRKRFINSKSFKILTESNEFINTVTKRLVGGHYNNGYEIFSKALKSAAGQMFKKLANLNFGKGFYKDWIATFLQSGFSMSFSKGLKSIIW